MQRGSYGVGWGYRLVMMQRLRCERVDVGIEVFYAEHYLNKSVVIVLDRKSLREVHDVSRVSGHSSFAYADQTRAIVGMSITQRQRNVHNN